jgi:hypothetical protein
MRYLPLGSGRAKAHSLPFPLSTGARGVNGLLWVVLLLWPCGLGAAEPQDELKRVGQLIEQLGSSSYQARTDAGKALAEIGGPALPALREALKSTDPEVRRRAEVLVRNIDQRLESQRLMAPSKLRLKADNASLAELMAELTKKTGIHLELQGETAKLADKKLTLDSGEVSVWEAVDLLCRKAGVQEKMVAAAPKPKGNGGITIHSMSIAGNRVIITDNTLNREPDEMKLLLVEGEAFAPTSLAGAFRLRPFPTLERPRIEGEVGLTLELTAEPRIGWQKLIRVRLDRAVDDQDQLLEQVIHLDKDRYVAPRTNIYIGGMPLIVDEGLGGNQREVPIYLKAGKEPTKQLKELRGVISGQIQTAPAPLMVMENILKAKDQLVKSPASATLKVVNVVKQDDGTYRLQLHLGAPPKRLDTSSGIGGDGVTIVNNRAIAELEEAINAPPTNFSLLDAKGQPWKIKEMASRELRNVGRFTQEYDLVFEPGEGRGEPDRLVYTGWRLAVVDVPFTLKNVPVP